MVWLDAYAVSGAHLMYQAGFLTYRSSLASPSHILGSCNGSRSPLPEYSDQFAQDLHLIPSSENAYKMESKKTSSAPDTAIFNYTSPVYKIVIILSIKFFGILPKC